MSKMPTYPSSIDSDPPFFYLVFSVVVILDEVEDEVEDVFRTQVLNVPQ